MKKLISIVALFAVVLLASSGFNARHSALAVGDEAPELQVSNSDGMFNLNEHNDKYVLLTFWSSSDAQSRVDCNKYHAWFNDNMPQNIKHVGVNFDTHDELFEEIVRLDSFDTRAHYNVQGVEADMIRSGFGLNNGFGSVLISPDGRVNTFNPTAKDLSSLI